MDIYLRKYILKFVLWSAVLFCALGLIVHFYSPGDVLALFIPYILSLAFVGSNFWNVKNVKMQDHRLFQRKFYRSMAGRFVLVLAAVIVVLLVKNEGEIFFIISFMFFYLCLSVIEVFTIYKLLKTNRKD